MCRRRPQAPIAAAPVAKVFASIDQYQQIEHRATMARLRAALSARGLLIRDAFRAFDSDRNGLVGCTELYSGLHHLGIQILPEQVR